MKLFLSGGECAHKTHGFEQLKQHNNRFYLYGFLYLEKTKEPLDYLGVKADEIMLDSGAHTLQKPGKDVDWDRFVHRYIHFVNKYKNYLDYIVELDVENKIGMKQVEAYRKQIARETQMTPLVVWHRGRGFDYLKYMTKTYPYIGFSGFVEDKTGEEEVPNKFINTFCNMAHKNSCRVHGFGYTRADLPTKKFDSVDSSSWLLFRRFGKLDVFDGRRMKKYEEIKNWKRKDVPLMADFNVREWVKYQTYLRGRD